MLRIKRAHSPCLRDEVFALRYRFYRKEEAVPRNALESFEDEYDYQSNHILWVLTADERVVGSIRTTWSDPAVGEAIPEMRTYGEEIAQLVPDGSCVLSGNRLVTEPDLSLVSSQFVLLLLRHHMMVASFRADWAVAAARTNHLAFYRRLLMLEKVSEAKTYPGLLCPMYLMACDFRANIDRVLLQTPLLKAMGYERLFLDNNYADLWEVGLPVEIYA
jgi:hypothetical protein